MSAKILAVIIAAILFTPVFALNIQGASAEVNDPRIPGITPTPYGTLTGNPTVVAGGGGDAIIVEGYFYYIQSYNPTVVRPIRGAEVEVYEDDGVFGKQKMGQGYTDDSGHYRITSLHNPIDLLEWSGADIYIELHASNWVTDVRDNPDWWGGSVYRFRGFPSLDTGDRDHVNFGSCTCPPEQNRVFDIFETMQAGYWFMVNETGNTPPKIRSFYNDILQGETAFYQGAGMGDEHGILSLIPDFIRGLYSLEALYYAASGIHFTTESSSHRTVLHEYGHYVMDLYMDLSPPSPVSPHNYADNYSDEHGLVEGWAHFFSAAVRHWWGAPVDEYRDDRPVEDNYIGSGCEAAVAGILWDIYDSPAIDGGVDDDQLTMSFNTIWSVLTHYDPDKTIAWPLGPDHPWTIFDFWDGFRSGNAGLPVYYLAGILTMHGIAIPDTIPPTNPDQVTTNPNVNQLSLSDRVTVTWSGAYDLYGDSHAYVKGYVIDFGYSPYEITEIPEPMHRDWARNVVLDIDGGGTWTSVAGLPENTYWLSLRALDYYGNFAPETLYIGPFNLIETGPLTQLEVSTPMPFNSDTYMRPDTSVTLEVIANAEVLTTHYEFINDAGESSGVQDYSNPFTLADLHLADGRYSFNYYSEGGSETDTVNTRTVILDSTAPTTSLTIGEPKQVVGIGKLSITQLTSSSLITLTPNDGEGSGVKETRYRINNGNYDLGWQIYQEPFRLTDMSDGAYWIEYYSTDNIGNEESHRKESLVLDNSGPSIRIRLVEGDTTIQDRITITSSAYDLTAGMGTLSYTLSRVSRAGLIHVTGFIDLPATSLPNNLFSLQLDISQLPNGIYLITAKGEDNFGNIAQTSSQYSLHNIDTIIDATTLLPKLQNAKAGRTVPIKFTLRTDPDQSFIYNEGLTIDIRPQGAPNPSQTSTFGVDSGSYRIDTTAELYIVNFKSASVPTTYQVTIYRGSTMIGSFTFSTTK